MKKALALFLAFALLLALAACGGSTTSSEPVEDNSSSTESSSESVPSEAEDSSEAVTVGRYDALQVTDQAVEIMAFFDYLTPSVNDSPTEENPVVTKATEKIVNAWLQDKPNVTFKWIYECENSDEWKSINFTAGTAPDMMYTWGTAGLNDDWYTVLDEAIASPNYYEDGNTSWQEMFPDYLFTTNGNMIRYMDKVVAVPLTLNPGSATAFYYNVDIFNELGLTPVTDFDEFVAMCEKIKDAGYVALAPSEWNIEPATWNWNFQFMIGPSYHTYFENLYNLDDIEGTTDEEAFYAAWNGKCYLTENEVLREVFQTNFDYYMRCLSPGYNTADYTEPWQNGQVAILEDQLAALPSMYSDTRLTFDFGMFPQPVKQSEFTDTIEYSVGPYNPAASIMITVMNPTAQDRPDYQVDYCVDFLKYLTTTENESIMVEEQSGSCIGAVKGCQVPAALTDWFTRQFPQLPSTPWILAPYCTGTYYASWIAEEENVINGITTFDEFCVIADELLYNDVQEYVATNDVEFLCFDPAEWGEMVKPASMR